MSLGNVRSNADLTSQMQRNNNTNITLAEGSSDMGHSRGDGECRRRFGTAALQSPPTRCSCASPNALSISLRCCVPMSGGVCVCAHRSSLVACGFLIALRARILASTDTLTCFGALTQWWSHHRVTPTLTSTTVTPLVRSYGPAPLRSNAQLTASIK